MAEATDYYVRLLMKVRAGDPGEAAATFVDQLMQRGLIDWVFQVEDAITEKVLGHFDGYGNPVNVEGYAVLDVTPESVYAKAKQDQIEAGKEGDDEWFTAHHRSLLQQAHLLPSDEQLSDEATEPIETIPLPEVEGEEGDAELLAVAEQASEG